MRLVNAWWAVRAGVSVMACCAVVLKAALPDTTYQVIQLALAVVSLPGRALFLAVVARLTALRQVRQARLTVQPVGRSAELSAVQPAGQPLRA